MYLMSELACEVERRVSAVGAGVDVGAAVARQQLHHVRVAVLGRPVQRREPGDEVARLKAQQLKVNKLVKVNK